MPRKHNGTSPEVYRSRATECMELANTARPLDRALFLRMAQAWLALSDQAVAENALMADDKAHSEAKHAPMTD